MFSRYFRWVPREPAVLIAALLLVLGAWGFAELTDEVIERETGAFDEHVMKALRRADSPGQLIGPGWVQSVVRDITALGGVVVLFLLVGGVAGFLLITRRYGTMWLVLIATLGATLINTLLKVMIARPRPQIVPRLTEVTSASFPSGHSAMSAAVYLTLAVLLARTVPGRRAKLYLVVVAMVVIVLVGLSRVALGVHFPTDVLAGWTAGLVWALLCWLVARYLGQHGTIEKEETAPMIDPAP